MGLHRARVLVGTLFQEASSFARGTTTRAGFETAGLMVGGDLRRDRLAPGLELAAAWDALEEAGLQIVPGLFAWAPPGPPVRAADFEALAAELVARCDPSLGGVYLQLHGSMLAEGIDDPEGLLLTRIRERIGPAVPIAVSFDCHATMSRAIAGHADIVTAYRTCPHLDTARTGRQAGQLLARAVAGSVRPVVAWAPLAMITPPGRHDNDFPPFASMMRACDEVEQRPGILAAAMLPSQPWLDVPDLGWSAVVTADGDRLLAERSARDIALGAWERREAFLTGLRLPIAQALDLALGGPAPYVVADAGDATNGGSTGDSTELLRVALSHQDRRIWLTVADEDAALALRALDPGTETAVTLGSGPQGAYNEATTVVGRVLAHPAGPFVYSHPFSRGLTGDLGTSAVLGIGSIRVVVHARAVGLIDAEPYAGAGLDPRDAEVLQAKSHISYRAGFAPITDRSIVADTPGPTTGDLATLPWRRRPRPLWPFEEPATPWRDPGGRPPAEQEEVAMLSSRDRVAAALRGEEPDRVPYCEVYLSRAFAHPLMGWPGELDLHASFEANEFSLEEAKAVAERVGMDNITYVLRAPIYADKTEGKDGTLFYGAGHIRTQADLAMVQLPDPHDDALYAEAAAFAANKGPYSAWFITRVGISPTMMSMGIEEFSLALHDDRRLVERLLDMYVDWVEVVAERICRLDFDVFVTTDDIAYLQGLFFSPGVFRELVYPRFERLARKITIPWLFHSDGNVTELLDDFVELGIRAIQPVEPAAMDIREVKRRYGGRLCLCGNVDMDLLARGTPEQVDEVVRRLIRDVAPGGGYIVTSGNSLAHYVRPENAIAMSQAVRRYGTYPISLRP